MYKKEKKEKAIATLIGCTRRKKRPKSIVEIANIIEFLCKELGSYKAVADTVGLSTEMLREFRSVEYIDPDIRELVEKRIIDSVDFVYRISKLDAKEQKTIVDKFIRDELTGDDVRVVKSFIKGDWDSGKSVLSKVIQSRDIKTYIVKFHMPFGKVKSKIKKRFEKIVGKSEIISFKVEKGTAALELSYRGQKRLREAAKADKITLLKFVTMTLEK